jgi:hypothetical protein
LGMMILIPGGTSFLRSIRRRGLVPLFQLSAEGATKGALPSQ